MTLRQSLPGQAILLVVFLGLATNSAGAQEQARNGIWGAAAVGFGSAQVSCGNCGSIERESSATGSLMVGTSLSQSFLLGAELDVWAKSINGDLLRLGSLAAIGQWYPSRTLGLFLKAGAGVSYARGDLRFPTSVFIDNAGLSYLAGVGYDVPVGNGISISPILSFYGGNVGDVQAADNVSFNVIQLLVALTVH